jgi:hypothetical protein
VIVAYVRAAGWKPRRCVICGRGPPPPLHEIKYDGYRLIVVRDGDRVRLITRNGYDWTKRYPWIVVGDRAIRSHALEIPRPGPRRCTGAGHQSAAAQEGKVASSAHPAAINIWR